MSYYYKYLFEDFSNPNGSLEDQIKEIGVFLQKNNIKCKCVGLDKSKPVFLFKDRSDLEKALKAVSAQFDLQFDSGNIVKIQNKEVWFRVIKNDESVDVDDILDRSSSRHYTIDDLQNDVRTAKAKLYDKL